MTKTKRVLLQNKKEALISLFCRLKDYKLQGSLLKSIRKLDNRIKGVK